MNKILWLVGTAALSALLYQAGEKQKGSDNWLKIQAPW